MSITYDEAKASAEEFLRDDWARAVREMAEHGSGSVSTPACRSGAQGLAELLDEEYSVADLAHGVFAAAILGDNTLLRNMVYALGHKHVAYHTEAQARALMAEMSRGKPDER